MIKLSYEYNQTSSQLIIEGLPDYSVGQKDTQIGILSSWKLKLIGFPDLEGKKEHLQSLISVVIPYARSVLVGQKVTLGSESCPITIKPNNNKHKLELRSSQEGVNPINIELDDAELSDLIRCLDTMISDPRILIQWDLANEFPILRSISNVNKGIKNNFLPPVVGGLIILLVGFISYSIPIPIEDTNSSIESIKKQ
tara:strand:- start:1603 stop:2193 length:591 start_codon:yes stop_codon:yes gene_type:complete